MKLRHLILFALLALPRIASAHCEIPCGIYDDAARFTAFDEHITTIEKSMNSINTLSAEGETNYNQLVRWVTNKEAHATALIEIVTQYFLTQRIKQVAEGADGHDVYVQKLALLHGMIRSAMKCKQTTDLEHVAKLQSLKKEFETLYMTHHSH